jgi:hypothetical protein
MCLPDRSNQSSGSASFSIVTGVVMLLACIGGPALIGLAGSVSIGAIVAPLGVIVAVAGCAVLPLGLGTRQRSRARPSTDDAAAANSSINTP